MSYQFNAYDGAVVALDGSMITFNTSPDMGLPGTTVRIIGSTLAYDEATGVMTGTITTIELFDPAANMGSGAALQTVDIALANQATLAASITAFLGEGLGIMADTFTAWDLAGTIGYDHTGNTTFAANGTSLKVALLDLSDTVVGYLLIAGTGLTGATFSETGTITAITQLDTDGATPLNFVDYLATPHDASAFSYGLLSLGGEDGNNEELYPFLVGGGVTITKNGGTGYGQFQSGSGNDTFITDSGGFVSYFSATAGVSLNLAKGTASGGGGSDTWVPNSIGGAEGSNFNDTIQGSNFGNLLQGGFGNDTMYGSKGADTMMGEAGKDYINGGAGKDILSGGTEKDVFNFNAVSEAGKSAATRDRIKDFQHNIDDIDLKNIDANTTKGADQKFSFIGTKDFSHTAGELHYLQSGGKTIIEGDTNGDGRADFQIELTGIKTLTSGDFVL